MTRDDILAKVRVLAHDQFGIAPEEVTAVSDITDDLGADSLERTALWSSLEEEFNICLDDATVDGLQTVGDIVDAVGAALDGKGAPR